MVLRVPDSGSLFGSILGGLGDDVAAGYGDAVEDVTEAQLGAALTAMARGDIEYVILENGDEFVQAGGSGDGPYELEFSAASGDMQHVRGGVTEATARHVLIAYLRGDVAWRGACAWEAM